MSSLLPFRLSKVVEKNLKKIRKTDRVLFEKIEIVIDTIREDPSVGDPKLGDLEGYFCVNIRHLRIEYRICYTVEEDENGELVVIIMIGSRENFYRDLKRYLDF
ncbi:type II toxin-antitoxin system RelE/ParE family toxin [Weizmannia sp. FSL W8-0676]|uniref:type II toxin-antitoxin system RelE/ParE family toxin n=1 Tax=Weizmannia sp. FSL W8-0676 TaxID=2954703 RepID=UPI003158C333